MQEEVATCVTAYGSVEGTTTTPFLFLGVLAMAPTAGSAGAMVHVGLLCPTCLETAHLRLFVETDRWEEEWVPRRHG
jgi:hypothetical protein